MSEARNARRTLQGRVVSTKATKTATISVERTFKHRKYGKYVRRRKKYMAHDEAETARVGDQVEIVSTRPLSKLKRWRIVRVLERAVLSDGAKGGQP